MNLVYQSFQGLERQLPTGEISEGRLFEHIGRQEQWFQDLEDHVSGLHNQSMEVGDRLADLETGHCCCWDVVVEGPPASLNETPISLSLSAVRYEGAGMSETAVENTTLLPVLVHGQQAR